MPDSSDMIIFWAVVLGRLLLPLLIPLWPLPGVLICLVLDGVDQTIFQQFTSLPLEGYQGYDKSLDIYYLTVAYIATFRNWANLDAFNVSRFLYYYRLVGVALFEALQIRWLLLVFPNTFEYFFIYYEAVRTRWNPARFSKRYWIIAAALIWIFIKLPQEYWIHVAQLDTTDLIKSKIFGVATTATWMEAIANRPMVLVVAGIALVAIAALIWWLWKRLPAPDHAFRLEADPLPEYADELNERLAIGSKGGWFGAGLLEKIILIGFVSVIFSHVLGIYTSTLVFLIELAVVVAANALFSQMLIKRRVGWESAAVHFVAMLGINSVLAIALIWFTRFTGSDVNTANVVFYLLLVTLIVTLYDRYRPIYTARVEHAAA